MSNSSLGSSITSKLSMERPATEYLSALINKVKPFAFLLVLWEAVVQFQLVDPSSLPHTYVVGQSLVDLVASGTLFDPAITSIYRMIAAFALAATVGTVVGLLMGRFRPVRWFVDPIVSVAFPTPKIVLVPMFLIWFGFGSLPIILLAAMGAVFPIIITTSQGAQNVKKELIWTARSVNMTRRGILREVVLPSSLPQIFNGLQIGLFLTIVVTVVSEMVSSGSGLGQALIISMDYYRTDEALAYLLFVMVVGVTANRVFKTIRAHLLGWTESNTGAV